MREGGRESREERERERVVLLSIGQEGSAPSLLSISAHLECKCGFYTVPLCCF